MGRALPPTNHPRHCLINNLNDAVAWGLFPILFSTHHLDLTHIGLLGALYPAFGALRSSAPTASSTSG
jgi:hypothetical protein